MEAPLSSFQQEEGDKVSTDEQISDIQANFFVQYWKKPLSEEELAKLAENSDLEDDSEEDIDGLHESSQIDYELSEEEEVLDAAEDDMVHTVDFDVSVTHTPVPVTSLLTFHQKTNYLCISKT
ncbi:hypothetical protein QE152_g23380 [Popillia japonica]|uniref:Uncharacterized protein n=1 Tax=Popillia japonica TaxID=7064 RepID=A0AAW1KHR1_POPJA